MDTKENSAVVEAIAIIENTLKNIANQNIVLTTEISDVLLDIHLLMHSALTEIHEITNNK